jgi:transcriptional regulator with GAF, ATPase, and Fis domain
MEGNKVKALLTFVGNNDQYPFERPGAILTALSANAYDLVYLFINNESYLPAASEINRYCNQTYPDLKVSYIDCPAGDPTDYNLVYPAMYSAVKKISEELIETEFTISITSGTPTMHSCWIFLVQGGVIDAQIIQVARSGAINPVSFSLDDFPQISNIQEAKAELTRLHRENQGLKDSELRKRVPFIGESPEILKIKDTISKISHTDLSILITGDSGTGKEEIAKSIHYLSHRVEHPLVTINCGAIPGQLFESELFGYRQGAFTGAVQDKDGQLTTASGGTVFLDEIGDLELEQQVKLLRVIEYRKYTPLGATDEMELDARFVFATNQDLSMMVQKGEFREDLFYRIAQFPIELPPLSIRGNDKMLLADKFISDLNRIHSADKRLSQLAVKKILEFPWPGNVRQLKNTIEAAFQLGSNEISEEDVRIITSPSANQAQFWIPEEGVDFDNDIVPAFYRAALRKTNGNAAQAARLLGLEPHTFRARLNKSKNIYHKK